MNKSQTGHRTLVKVMTALVNLDKALYVPFGDHGRVDLIYEEEDGRLVRVQCKTAWVAKGCLVFPTTSVDSRSVKGRTLRRGYRGEADLFGVYCPVLNRVYLIPVEDVPQGEARLRLTPPKNNQKKKIRWAAEYEIGAVAQLGERYNGIVEVTGSTPVGSTLLSPDDNEQQPLLPFGGEAASSHVSHPTRLPRKPR
jgi:hypothetical protein